MVNFKENYHFQGSGGDPNFSRWVVLLFPGRGFNCLFPIEPHITCDFPGGSRPSCPPPPLDPRLTFSTLPTLLWFVYVSTLFHPLPHPPPPTTIPRSAHICTILHIMYMYIYHFLVSWNGRELDYWHTNRVGSVLSAAHTFYVTPTSQRACALAFMSPISTVSVFYVTPDDFCRQDGPFYLAVVTTTSCI